MRDNASQRPVDSADFVAAAGGRGVELQVYDYWRQFRNAANIVLLFGFIAVIFSQATSIGLSAYGIKKLLPRLMAFAIIINLSFFICQLAVDVSNIVGSGIMSVAVSVVEGANTQADSTGSVNPLSETADEKWLEVKNIVSQGSNASGGSVAAVLTGGIIGAITLPMLAAMVLPILIIAFLALLVGFVVLIARQIILIGMIVLSPIGIAAAVLPGTKKFYEFWKNTFSSMLFMYPIISMLFGGSFLAADLLGDERLNFFSNPALEAVADGLMTLAIIIVLVSPFFAIPFVIKTSGGMLGKLTGALDKFSMGAGSKAKNYAKERWGEAQKDRQNKYTANLPYRHPLNPRAAMARSRIARMERYRNNEEGAKISTAKIAAEQVRKNPRASEEQKARAEAVLNELSNKEAEIKLKFTYGGDAVKALTEGIRSGDQALINTASSKLIGDGKLDEVQTKMASMSQEQLMATARGINSDSALFGKAKEQDMGFAYALEDASKAQFKNAATGAVDTGLTGSDFMTKFNTAGVNGYDMKVRDAKANAVVGQEAWAIHRQATNGSLDSATAVKVIGQTYTDRGQYKAPQKQELISAAGGALGGRYSNYN